MNAFRPETFLTLQGAHALMLRRHAGPSSKEK
jgi:hypothetical protein